MKKRHAHFILKTCLIFMMLATSFSMFSQNITIRGTVKDSNNETVIGATIIVNEDVSRGTVSDYDGNFVLSDVPPNSTLQVSYVGLITQTVSVNGRSNIDIIMASDTQSLDEIVVVGYGVVRKSDLTGAVGSISSDEITAKGSTSVMEALQGAIPGVNITQSSSRVGDGMSIQIRGKSSLQGGSPLYVIDGVVFDNMDFLNPMDIETIDVLKDASSTAIYGSRATNGVLMITTKKGERQEGKASVSYDGYYGYKNISNMPDFMDGDQFMQYRFSRYLTSQMNPTTGATTWNMSDANLANVWGANSAVIKRLYLEKDYTDWPSLVTRDGQQQNHFVNVSGNAKNISYRFGMGYQDEKGVLYDSYDRWNIKGAVEHKISDKVLTGFTTNMATSTQNNGSRNSVSTGFGMTPLMKAYYWEGEDAGKPILQPGKDPVLYPDGGGPTSTFNPIVDRLNSKIDTKNNDVMANLYIQYSPTNELILKTSFAPAYKKMTTGVFYGAESEYRRNQATNYAENNHDEFFSYTWDTQANYIKGWGDHNINLLGLFSMYDMKMEGNNMIVTNMPFDVDWYNLSSGSIQSQGSYYTHYSMLSYVTRLNYDYKGKYLATLSSRWDGSSKFQKGSRWGVFPSAAFAWRVSEESFMMPASDWLSNLKLRLSYGLTGNNASVGAYETQSMAGIKYNYNFGSRPVIGYGSALSNADLTWEKTYEFNVGLDFGIFNNRISGNIDWYNRISKDLLMELETPLEVGSSTGSIWDNVGKVKNTGVELQLNTLNINTSDLNWTTSFTFAYNRNEILELNGGKEDLVGNWWFIGQPIDVVYGYELGGVTTREEAAAYAANPDKKTKFYEGEMEIVDRDGNGTINADDKTVIGHNSPTWTGGVFSNLTYKGWDLGGSLYISQGSMVASPFMVSYASYSSRGTQHINMDYYIPQGAPILGPDGNVAIQSETHYGKYPFPTGGSNNSGQGSFYTNDTNNSMFFVNNSFAKIKNIALGYTMPQSWIAPVGLSYLRVYLNVQNPFVFTKYEGFDPEWADANINNGTGGPASRTFQIGVNMNF